ncbi:MAG: hypothetical protein ACK5KL_11875 [Dysgonomonas sp.]
MMIDEDNEEKINKKKEKKLSKHFDILINNRKVKILNYQIKDYKTSLEDGKSLILISKFQFDRADRGEDYADIEIITEKEKLVIKGEWKSAWSSSGNYGMTYLIKELNYNE